MQDRNDAIRSIGDCSSALARGAGVVSAPRSRRRKGIPTIREGK